MQTCHEEIWCKISGIHWKRLLLPFTDSDIKLHQQELFRLYALRLNKIYQWQKYLLFNCSLTSCLINSHSDFLCHHIIIVYGIMFTVFGVYVHLTVQLGQISSSLVCRCVSIASATSLGERTWCEDGRIGLMTTSTSVTLFRGDGNSLFCFTTRILKRRTDGHTFQPPLSFTL